MTAGISNSSEYSVAPLRLPGRLETPGPRLTAMLVIPLIAIFGGLAYTAVVGKSATYDEPLHAVAGQVIRQTGDYRIDPEDGALFLHWSALLHGSKDIALDLKDEDFNAVFHVPENQNTFLVHSRQWVFCVRAMYQITSTDADAFLNRARAMFVITGMILGALIAWWGFKLGGWIASVAAAILFCLDPNFLAHTGVAKNDVPLALLMLWLATSVWILGRQITVRMLLLTAIACGAGLTVKFSGLLFGPMVAILLVIRALLPQPWPMMRWMLSTRPQRLAAAVACCVFIALFSWFAIWACYSFRYSPAPPNSFSQQREFEMQPLKLFVADHELRAKNPKKDLTPQEIQSYADANRIGRMARLTFWMDSHKLLPQAWSFGLIYTYATTLIRSTFLNGQFSDSGWWYYFPLAMLYKTPTATLVMIVAACIGSIVNRVSGFGFRVSGEANPGSSYPTPDTRNPTPDLWSLACLLIPPVIYAASAMATNLNLGLRHILPVYPFIFLGVGIGLARMIGLWPKIAITLACAMIVGLVIESGFAYPDYLAFFNTPSGGSRGGIRLLSDSNLDWGQDLKLLAAWQDQHPDLPLYLCYFGMADPGYYKIVRQDLVGGWPFGRQINYIPNVRGVVAISATNVQGTYFPESLRNIYRGFFWDREPREVLGGSIYIYDWPVPAPTTSSTSGGGQ